MIFTFPSPEDIRIQGLRLYTCRCTCECMYIRVYIHKTLPLPLTGYSVPFKNWKLHRYYKWYMYAQLLTNFGPQCALDIDGYGYSKSLFQCAVWGMQWIKIK